MKKIITIILFIIASDSFTRGEPDLIFLNDFEEPEQLEQYKRVFLSGHSLMDNPYADYLEVIADGKGVDYNWNQQNGIGSPIRVRTSGDVLPDMDPNNNAWAGYARGKNRDTFDMDVITELANPATLGTNEVYDSLVITERHDILGVIRFEYTNSLLRHYHNRLLAGNPNGQTYFYQSWWFMDFNDIQEWIDHTNLELKSYECVTEKVNLTLDDDGLPRAIHNIPAGMALVKLVEAILDDQVPGFTGTDTNKMDLLFHDDVHLSDEGIFFMSAVTYASLLKSSPVGITIPAEIDSSTGQALLQIAWDVINEYDTNFTAPTMSECRVAHETEICSSYWNMHDQPEFINSCQTWMNNTGFGNNPFNWPDPDLITWPDP